TLELLELLKKMVTIAVALGRVLLQEAQDDGARIVGAIFANAFWIGRGSRALEFQESVAIPCAKRKLARHHFKEQDTERVEIRLWASLFTTRLFRRHVFRRAKHGTFGREPRIMRKCG